MSYTRFGSPVPGNVPVDDLMNFTVEQSRLASQPAPDWTAIHQHRNAWMDTHGQESSYWYIFASGPAAGEPETLAMWHAAHTLWKGEPLYHVSADDLRRIQSEANWTTIPGYDESSPLQQHMVREIAQLWLNEIDQSSAPPTDSPV